MDRRSDNATSVDVEIDPHCRRLGRSQTDFAFQAIVECRAAKAKRVAVLLRWHADGGEVRRGLAVGLEKEKTQLRYRMFALRASARKLNDFLLSMSHNAGNPARYPSLSW